MALAGALGRYLQRLCKDQAAPLPVAKKAPITLEQAFETDWPTPGLVTETSLRRFFRSPYLGRAAQIARLCGIPTSQQLEQRRHNALSFPI